MEPLTQTYSSKTISITILIMMIIMIMIFIILMIIMIIRKIINFGMTFLRSAILEDFWTFSSFENNQNSKEK